MSRISIMIVDDHTLIRETWSFLLGRNEGFEVIAEVGDGQQAIEIARDKRPNIILLDINMSPLNGFDILKMVRKLSPGSKVIAVSMHSQPAYAKKCYAWERAAMSPKTHLVRKCWMLSTRYITVKFTYARK
ncbi:response regulator transcription factor [Paraflavitalea speifideaquila]|uniref:response regulator n=1 Tax=Paraflavitalea speifideaquila TaxID=3076558 RepID=UPI0028EFB5AA|nr:response regulator transcription factor [Paraflavitalea speifideiaquila]